MTKSAKPPYSTPPQRREYNVRHMGRVISHTAQHITAHSPTQMIEPTLPEDDHNIVAAITFLNNVHTNHIKTYDAKVNLINKYYSVNIEVGYCE